MRVLLIEDNVRLGEATTRSLVKAGFTVDLFDTLEDGWHAWRSVTYDVVILDIMLGRENGLDLLAQARAAGLRTPVLMLTALGSIDQRVQGLERGADDYLIKPFAIEELVARLRALGRRPDLTADVLRYGDIEYDQGAREICVGEARLPSPRRRGRRPMRLPGSRPPGRAAAASGSPGTRPASAPVRRSRPGPLPARHGRPIARPARP